MNAAVSTPPTIKDIEAAAQEVQRHVRQAVDHATAGDYRRAHAEAEAAQGLCRKLKELLGTRTGHADDGDRNKPAIKAGNPRPWKAKRP